MSVCLLFFSIFYKITFGSLTFACWRRFFKSRKTIFFFGYNCAKSEPQSIAILGWLAWNWVTNRSRKIDWGATPHRSQQCTLTGYRKSRTNRIEMREISYQIKEKGSHIAIFCITFNIHQQWTPVLAHTLTHTHIHMYIETLQTLILMIIFLYVILMGSSVVEERSIFF